MPIVSNKISVLIVLLGILAVSSITPAQSQDSQEPYIYYFSDVLQSFVIERIDGSDSRPFAVGAIPSSHNSINGPGWSPSGQWFAFASSIRTPHSIYDHQNKLISLDEQSVIPFPDQTYMEWSPIQDLLLYKGYNFPGELQPTEEPRIGIFDPNQQASLFEYRLDNVSACTEGGFWNADGSKVAWCSFQEDQTIVYNLSIPNFTLTQRAIGVTNDQRIYNDHQQFLFFTTNDGELVSYDVFSHQEVRFPFGFSKDAVSISLFWNTPQSEAFIRVSDYQSNADSIFWISLVQERVEMITTCIDTEDNLCYPYIFWNAQGDRAIIERFGESFFIQTPSLQQIPLGTPDYYFTVWLDNQQALFFGRDSAPTTRKNIIVDATTGAFESVVLPLIGWRNDNTTAALGRYILIGNTIFSVPSFGQIARSRMSNATLSNATLKTVEGSHWAIIEDYSFFPLSGYRAMNYEAVELYSTRTRELTNCSGNLCIDWLPRQVDLEALRPASAQSVVPAPRQSILVDNLIERVLWSSNGNLIHLISTDYRTETSMGSVWEVASESLLFQYELPYCETPTCFFEQETSEPDAPQDTSTPLINETGAFQITFETDRQQFVIRELKTRQVLAQWGAEDFPFSPSLNTRYSWVGNSLIFISGASSICLGYWHPHYMYRPPAIPLRCHISPTEDFVFFTDIHLSGKNYLLDTATGSRIPINFYARDGAFSPDGTRLALGTHSRLTIWEVADIVSIAPQHSRAD